jgi:hypothetical protein
VRAMLGIPMEDLAGDWRAVSGPSPSQLLGARLVESQYEAAICPSAIEPNSANLVVFVRNVDSARALHVVRAD